MAYLVVDGMGCEYIFNSKPVRVNYEDNNELRSWDSSEFISDGRCPLEPGTIFILIGRHLEYEDEPVNLDVEIGVKIKNAIIAKIRDSRKIEPRDLEILNYYSPLLKRACAESINVDTFLDKICQQ